MYEDFEGKGMRLMELKGLQIALESVTCKECCTGHVVVKENLVSRQGLYTEPYLFCEGCSKVTKIPFSKCHSSKAFAVNRHSVLASKCVGGTHASLEMFCGMLNLPPPVSKVAYVEHMNEVRKHAILQAKNSMVRARQEVREHYKVSGDEFADITISCDGTWQRRGFSSLFGAVFVISHDTGKVLDYVVKSKHCAGCSHWEFRDHTTDEYKTWKETHDCKTNFTGSACAMEPAGTLEMFCRSTDYKIRYKNLISDGDSKSHAMILEEQPYGTKSDEQVKKLDCVGHVQKRLGTALRNLKQQYRGQKLSDGKTIGGAGRLTDALINSLQNYYGDVIRRNKGDLDKMIKGVQATLLHSNSSDETPRHHLCPEGENSWCKWQVAKAKGVEYKHKKDPFPTPIVQLLKPIYKRLGSHTLLEKCLDGYTQNANESFHSVIWKFCPKELFLGRDGVETACALAISNFNDGASSLTEVAKRLGLEIAPFSKTFLAAKDKSRLKISTKKASERTKDLRRKCRKKRKGFADKNKQDEGVVYAAGAFGEDPGPCKKRKTK